MRIQVTSVSRARKLAKSLRGILVEHCDLLVGHVEAQAALARMLGYQDWAELLKVTIQRSHPPSPFDDAIGQGIQQRIDFQAKSLMGSFPLSVEDAYRAAGRLRASAAPVGRHCPPDWSEDRGVTPMGTVMSYTSSGFRAMRTRLTEEDVKLIIANTNTRIFMKVEEMDVPTQVQTLPPG